MATLIYHIWSNVPSKSQISIIDFSISNHLTNFLVFNYRFIFKFNEIKKVYFRDFSIKNKQDFIDKINDSMIQIGFVIIKLVQLTLMPITL